MLGDSVAKTWAIWRIVFGIKIMQTIILTAKVFKTTAKAVAVISSTLLRKEIALAKVEQIVKRVLVSVATTERRKVARRAHLKGASAAVGGCNNHRISFYSKCVLSEI
ncbi:MAG: hypothetical protein J6A28_04750 [Clostridia bacterium]|nr:hypothetical protein [Clostridia bacterium]